VVVDDTAVTPAYVCGLASAREPPIIKRIAKGSLRNKLLLILPAALILSAIAPIVVEILFMAGGVYLCFEGAIRTDLILSAEVMVIAPKEVIDEGFVQRATILVVVAFLIAAIAYGVVALIVKMDDVGLALVGRQSSVSQRIGRMMVVGMPKLLGALSVIGTAAMLWVGGHILLVGSDQLGWHGPYDFVHHLEETTGDETAAAGDVLAWLVNTSISAAIGLAVGAVIVAVASRLRSRNAAR